MSTTITYYAAGGVLVNLQHTKVLLLVRPAQDEVRLPKGHIEPGETSQDTALREVMEETGYNDLEIITDLGEQLVIFTWKNRIVRRNEHYYLMHVCSSQQTERLPEDEQQFFPTWASWAEAQEYITFEAEREWLQRAYRALELDKQ
ncbi:MAG: NUDIX domain-containing protein [Anaerolineae bacterium]|nr:NUDIX domain-containing protein [Anaerolineae bacterium]